MVTEMASADTLLALARSDEQRRFVMDAVTFLSGRATPRVQQNAAWGVGDEALTLFHETGDEQEHAEADAARRWQKLRWQAGFGWITARWSSVGAACRPITRRFTGESNRRSRSPT